MWQGEIIALHDRSVKKRITILVPFSPSDRTHRTGLELRIPRVHVVLQLPGSNEPPQDNVALVLGARLRC